MSRKIAIAIAMFLAASSAWAQSPTPAPSPAATAPVPAPDARTTTSATSRFTQKRNARAAEAQVASRERMREMATTLDGMRALLKQMQAKNASSRSKDPVAKANLEMWELLLGHLDKELHELQLAAAQEDFEGRRAALYNQAMQKAAAEAAAARQTAPAPATPAAPKPDQP